MDPWKENWDDDDEDYICSLDEEDEDEDDSIDWFENDVPANCRDFGDTCVQSGSSSGAKKSNETNRQTKTKSTPNKNKKARKDEEKESVKPRRTNHKVEMRSVCLSNDMKNQIMSTLRSIHGENFSLNTDVAQSKRRLDTRYWVDQGQLIIRNCYNFAKKKNPNELEVNSIQLETLESYGFFTKHCHEVLVHTKNNLEESIKLLINFYFGVEYRNETNETIMKSASDMNDELIALKSIYENMMEEKVVHKHWIFHLELPHLAEWHFQSAFNEGPIGGRNRQSGRGKPLCRNYSARGTCKFGSNCRFLHEDPGDTKKSIASDDERRKKSSFDLEIIFPEECAYPNGVPIILFIAQHKEFSKHACLRVTKLLLKEASDCASQGYAYCYNLVDLLLNSDKVLDWLKNETESAINIDSNKPLFNIEVDDHEDELPSSNSAVTKPNYKTSGTRSVASNRDDDIIYNMERKYYKRDYQNMLHSRKNLPAWNSSDKILNLLKDNQVVVVVGETGCGKSTQIPQFILDQWLYPAARISSSVSPLDRVEIICTQPRRISAIGVASRVAQERLEKVGEVVGYQISLESSMSSLTKLLFCTTGILLKKLVGDPLLESVTHVIVDEVHERSEESDFLLLILKELLAKRKDLKVILMSATLNAGLFSSYFDGAPLLEIPGKMFPVSELYLEDILEECGYVVDEYSKNCRKMSKTMTRMLDDNELALAESYSKDTASKFNSPDECLSVNQLFYRYKDYSVTTRKTILMMDHEKVDPELIVTVLSWIVDGEHTYPHEGSILVFLPGMADITAVHDELRGHRSFNQRNGQFLIIPLHSSISNEEQSLVFKKTPKGVRKIVLSTNIAETSITIDDCVFVVDCGKMKENRFDSNKNMSSLETVWISKANANQRRGRAGRVMPGLCIRLFTHHRFQHVMDAQPIPEIRRVPLDQIILFTRSLVNFQSLNIEDVLDKLIEPPFANNISTAIERLQNIGALDEEKELTALGRHLSVLPVDVKIGKLILFGAVFCCLDSVLTIAASLSNKSPFLSPFNKRNVAEAKKREFAICNSDHLTVLNAYQKWQEQAALRWANGKRFADENFLSWRTLETMADLKHQYLELLMSIGFVTTYERMRRRPHEDRVLKATPAELNKNGKNYRLLSSIICAALYPNLVEVLTPDKVYKPGVSGSVPSDHSAGDLKFKTRKDGYVNLHPASVNHGVSKFISPYLVYQEKIKTSKIFIHDSTMVHVIALILFAGAELKIEMNSGMYVASLEEGWLSFSFRSLEDGKMLQHMRKELTRLLEQKIENPHEHLIDNATGKRIISTITDIITKSTT